MWENINSNARELELLEHPFGDVPVVWADEEIHIGVPSDLAGVQPLAQGGAFDQDCAKSLTTEGRGYTGSQALQREGYARLSKTICIRAGRAQRSAYFSCRGAHMSGRPPHSSLLPSTYTLGMLERTGERVDVVGRPRTHTEQAHLNRYRWAAGQVMGDVLDAACGTGYGSRLLSRNARVFGLDANADAVALARERVPNGEFVIAELPTLPYSSERFNAVISFETIEHVQDDEGFLGEAARVLRRDGLLLLSTPNAAVTSPSGHVVNPWHVREYRRNELLTLIGRFFHSIEVFCQDLPPANLVQGQAHRLVARFPVLCRPGRWWDVLAHGRNDVVRWAPAAPEPVFWVLRGRRR
jgi:SAM-dependent methyltransferase